jgi:hypothetical protein
MLLLVRTGRLSFSVAVCVEKNWGNKRGETWLGDVEINMYCIRVMYSIQGQRIFKFIAGNLLVVSSQRINATQISSLPY